MSLHEASDQVLLEEMAAIVSRLLQGDTSAAQRTRDANTLSIIADRYRAGIDLLRGQAPLLRALAGYPNDQELRAVEETLNRHIDVLQTRL